MNYTRNLIHIMPIEDIVDNIATTIEYTMETVPQENRAECGRKFVSILLSELQKRGIYEKI